MASLGWPCCVVLRLWWSDLSRNHRPCCRNRRVGLQTLEAPPLSCLSWLAPRKLEGRGCSPAAHSSSLMCHGPKFATTGRPTSATQQSSTGRLGSRVWLACVINTSTSLPKRSMAACANRKTSTTSHQGPLFIFANLQTATA